jgi:hypothetical protein
MLWEVYVFHEDIEDRGNATIPFVSIGETPGPPQAAAPWRHRLTEPFPERIPHETNTLHEVLLEGSLNANRNTVNRDSLITEAWRTLRPGGEIHFHGLAADRASTNGDLRLPGPASVVEYVPSTAEIVSDFSDAGFADVRIDLLSQKACFVAGDVLLRECRIRAKKPGHRPKQKTHHAVYRGPLAEVKDDFGNVFRRGELTPLNVHDWQMLAKGSAGDAFILLESIEEPAACGD